MATSVNRLCLALQFGAIEVNEAKLQMHTQSVDRCGAVLGRKQPCVFIILDNLLDL